MSWNTYYRPGCPQTPSQLFSFGLQTFRVSSSHPGWRQDLHSCVFCLLLGYLPHFTQGEGKAFIAAHPVSWVTSLLVDLCYQLGLSAPRKPVIIHWGVSRDNWREWEMGKTGLERGQPKCNKKQTESLLSSSWTTHIIFFCILSPLPVDIRLQIFQLLNVDLKSQPSKGLLGHQL